MQVIVQQTGQTFDVTCAGNARDLLGQLGINPETVLIVVDGVLVTEDASVHEASVVELISVVSGG